MRSRWCSSYLVHWGDALLDELLGQLVELRTRDLDALCQGEVDALVLDGGAREGLLDLLALPPEGDLETVRHLLHVLLPLLGDEQDQLIVQVLPSEKVTGVTDDAHRLRTLDLGDGYIKCTAPQIKDQDDFAGVISHLGPVVRQCRRSRF